MNKKASILFFSLNPEKEAVRKQWTESKKVNIQIAKTLYKQTLSKVKASKLDYYIISNQDVDESFGANITSAIQQLFDRGIENLIVIGNDCPDITVRDLEKANQELNIGKHTFGQTKDGGSYLFSINKNKWNAEKFKNLPWCTTDLSQKLIQFLNNQFPVSELKTKADLNYLKDILNHIINAQTCISNLLKGLFLNIILSLNQLYIDVLSFNKIQLRGPPDFISR